MFGPLFFLLYVHSLKTDTLFDESTLYSPNKIRTVLEQTVFEDRNKYYHWLLNSKLSLNVEKKNVCIMQQYKSKTNEITKLLIHNNML